MLNRANVKADTIAGITAGVLILPQAIALAALAGMPPEYGLYTAIFPVIIAALFGSSWHAMAGPNTAICILIAFTIAPYASVASPEWIQYAITLAFMAAIIQITFGALRLGIIFNYFSQTVMVALITGVGIIIIISQLGNFMGVLMNTAEPIENALPQVAYAISRANWFAVAVGFVTVACGFLIKYYRPKWPFLIIAVLTGMLLAALLELIFSAATVQLDKLGMMSLTALPLSAPDFSPENFAEASQGLLPAAFFIAFLGLIQASLIARSMAAKSGQHIDINQEILGQGYANLAGSFLSCFPSCSSFNRSASNFEAKARTPLSALISVAALIILVIFATPLIAELPIAVMSGILILVGVGLIKKNDIYKLLQENNETRIIFTLTLATTLYGGLNNAVFLGIALSIYTYLRATSKPSIELLNDNAANKYLPQLYFHKDGTMFPDLRNRPVNNTHELNTEKSQKYTQADLFDDIEIEIHNELDQTIVLQLTGSLFFGSVHHLEQVFNNIGKLDNRQDDLIISAENMHYLDITGADALVREAKKRKSNGAKVSVWLRNHSLDKVLRSSGLINVVGKNNIYHMKINAIHGHFPPTNLH